MFTFRFLPYPVDGAVYPPPSSLLNALKYMYIRRELAMPRPSKIWPVRFKVVLNPVVPVFSYIRGGQTRYWRECYVTLQDKSG